MKSSFFLILLLTFSIECSNQEEENKTINALVELEKKVKKEEAKREERIQDNLEKWLQKEQTNTTFEQQEPIKRRNGFYHKNNTHN